VKVHLFKLFKIMDGDFLSLGFGVNVKVFLQSNESNNNKIGIKVRLLS